MPALTATEAREKAFPLTADDLEALIDCKIAAEVERGTREIVSLTDKDLGRGAFVSNFVRYPPERAHPILRVVVARFEAAGYRIDRVKPTPFQGDYLACHDARIDFVWSQ